MQALFGWATMRSDNRGYFIYLRYGLNLRRSQQIPCVAAQYSTMFLHKLSRGPIGREHEKSITQRGDSLLYEQYSTVSTVARVGAEKCYKSSGAPTQREDQPRRETKLSPSHEKWHPIFQRKENVFCSAFLTRRAPLSRWHPSQCLGE